MPARREYGAPSFDPQCHRELPRYFDSIKYLLTRSNITDPADQKWFATYYADLDVSDFWRVIPEYADPTCDFVKFKNTILSLYPEVSRACYRFADLESLVEEQSRREIKSIWEYGEYYRRFFSISTYLCNKKVIDKVSQSHADVSCSQIRGANGQ